MSDPTSPAGGHAEHPVYDAEHLPPPSDWKWWRNRRAVRMAPIGGPCTVHTVFGPVMLPVGWLGYLTVDAAGHPTPIGIGEHRRDYEPAGEPS